MGALARHADRTGRSPAASRTMDRSARRARGSLMRLVAVAASVSLAACVESSGASIADSATSEALSLRRRNAELSESLHVAQGLAQRQNIEKELLVREVHSADYFMQQLQGEFRRIRTLEHQAEALNPRQDPLSAMESERARILDGARAARLRLARLQTAA